MRCWFKLLTAAIACFVIPACFIVEESNLHALVDTIASKDILKLMNLRNKTRVELRAMFVPYPHRSFGVGKQMECKWKTKSKIKKKNIQKLAGFAEKLDSIQQNVLTEGLCLSELADAADELHIFSAKEATSCLERKTLVFVGDSHMKDLFIAIGDILMGSPSAVTPQDSPQRSKILGEIQETLEEASLREDNFPSLNWECESECSGKLVPWRQQCADCIKEFKQSAGGDDDSMVVILGVTQNLYRRMDKKKQQTVKELIMLHNAIDEHMILVSPPTEPSKDLFRGRGNEGIYWATIPWISKRSIPHLDVLQLSKSCGWKNCTTKNDPMHNARFVNRWKAQMLLNTVCEVHQSIVPVSNHTDNATVDDTQPDVLDILPFRMDKIMLEESRMGSNKAKTVAKTFRDGSTVRGPLIPTRVKFIPFPHRDIGVGKSMKCQWIARDYKNKEDSVVTSLLGDDWRTPDLIQASAFGDTMCLPKKNSTFAKLHLFSVQQAKSCLSNITLTLSGDSYTRNTFLELGEILFGRTNNVAIQGGKERTSMVLQMNEDLWHMFGGDSKSRGDFPDIQWICHNECYGRNQPFWKECSNCLLAFRKEHRGKQPVHFVGAGVHIYNHFNQSIPTTIKEIQRFWNATPNTLFATMPFYEISKLPGYWKAHGQATTELYELEQQTYKSFPSMRLFDYFQVTKACQFKNCSMDGGHRVRFVNRWKVQLLLNTLCAYEYP